ncbi:MAG: CHASE2 domain-containing protein [Spirochaetota bacterium]
MRRRFAELLVPVAIAAIVAALNLVPFYGNGERRVYDIFLRTRPAIPERDEILLLDVDDTAIQNVGLWPWSRDYMANGLITLTELGASQVVFDIEYVEPSPQAVDGRFLSEALPEIFSGRFAEMVDQADALFTALQAGQIPLSDASEFLDDWAANANDVRQDLVASVGSVARDNDSFLGRAARFHGSAYFTVNILDYEELTDYDDDLVRRKAALDSLAIEGDGSIRRGRGISPAIAPILSGGRGAGFPNVDSDPDGVRRRVDLLAEANGEYYAQLVLEPMLDWLGNPDVIAYDDRVVLEGALLPGDTAETTITVPVATDGKMLVNWPQGEYLDTFRHETYWRVIHDWQEEAALLELLRSIAPNVTPYYSQPDMLLPLYDYAHSIREEVLAGGDREQLEEWREYRAMFFEALGDFLESDAVDLLLADVRAAIESGEYTEEEIPQLEDLAAVVEERVANMRSRYEDFAENRRVLAEQLAGSFVIIGLVGTSTTDVGVTPFDEAYMNVGTHAAVVNAILQQEFLDDLPWYYSLAAMFVLAALVTLVISGMDPTPSLIVGFVSLLLILGGGIALFRFTGTYVNMVTPLVGVFLTFVALTAIKFVRENRQKLEIRNAFGHYMSEDVVKLVTEDPSRLALGGVKKHLTAMFTDIKGFSSISESLQPEQLTDLLNRYLSAMSDIVLNEGGTIDKYEGDAIIAFFGAPIDQPDSAVRACRAAIAMKKKERELNEEFLREGLTPSPIYTRIGINTGDMVVGNMGTARRMDYTAMGHNMNLAARLEGVNKQYGTWILISDQTYNEVNDRDGGVRHVSTRKLDRVRVVGISEPVRLYELIDLRQEVDEDPSLIDKLRTFNTGLNAFEQKDWNTAMQYFQTVLEEYPEDGPAMYYVERCKSFKRKPPARDWDGVFNLTKK